MRTDSEKRMLLWFMGGLFFVALMINGVFLRRDTPPPEYRSTPSYQPEIQQRAAPPSQPTRQPEQPAIITRRNTEDELEVSRREAQAVEATRAVEAAAATRRAAAEAAAQHAAFLARYLNPAPTRTSGLKTVAMAVATEAGKPNRALATALADKLKSSSSQIFSAFFTPAFLSDQMFSAAFADATQVFTKLELRNSVDTLVVARQQIQYSANPALENVITANMTLEVAVFPADAASESHSWTFTANGAGFRQTDARAMAEERLLRQIAADTRMSLNQ